MSADLRISGFIKIDIDKTVYNICSLKHFYKFLFFPLFIMLDGNICCNTTIITSTFSNWCTPQAPLRYLVRQANLKLANGAPVSPFSWLHRNMDCRSNHLTNWCPSSGNLDWDYLNFVSEHLLAQSPHKTVVMQFISSRYLLAWKIPKGISIQSSTIKNSKKNFCIPFWRVLD